MTCVLLIIGDKTLDDGHAINYFPVFFRTAGTKKIYKYAVAKFSAPAAPVTTLQTVLKSIGWTLTLWRASVALWRASV